MLYSSATIYIPLNEAIIERAKEFQSSVKLKPFDALHLSSAEQGGASVLLTTDKKFLHKAAISDAKIRVANPATWFMEVMFND
jgi:predicted nucleic acid-binding protein